MRRIFGQPLASSSHIFQTTGNIWIERRSTPQCWSTRYRHEGIRAIRSRRHWIHLGRSCNEYGRCLSTWNWYPIFPIHFWRFLNILTAANPKIIDDEEDKENSALITTTTPGSERSTETPRLLGSRRFGTRLEGVLDSVYRTLFR